MSNIAYIDGQNLYMSTTTAQNPWKVDLTRLRIYLNKKYDVSKAYYFLGFVQEEHQDLYTEIQEAGFILQFREHSAAMVGTKKGNVDTDIVFHCMKKLYENAVPGKVVLVSGDGDYKQMVDFLLQEEKLLKVLFPDGARASSLYKKITREYFDDLGKKDIRAKVGKRKGGLR